jgi:hypothetical protein
MKRFFALLAVLPAVALCGCDESAESFSLPSEYALSADITDGDFSCSADMVRREGVWEITLTAPQTVEGMTVALTDTDCTVGFSSLSYTVGADEIPDSAAIKLAALALDKCAAGKTHGTVCGADYTLETDGKSPKKLVIDSSVTVEFHDFAA